MSLLNLILLALVFVVVGFIGGALVAIWWMEREKTPAETQTRQSLPQQPDGEGELVALHWEKSSKTLSLELGGRSVTRPEMLPPEKRSELARMALIWLRWLREPEENPAPSVTPTPASAANRTQPARVKRAEKTGGFPLAAEQPSEPLMPISSENTTVATPSPITGSASPTIASKPGHFPRPLRNEGTEKPAAVPAQKPVPRLSIVEQIDEVLQEMLGASELAGRAIRLAEDPASGVVVRVGAEQYGDIDAIPDPAVRAIIRKAVAEWEQRAEGKRF